jgi:hypothetical protein
LVGAIAGHKGELSAGRGHCRAIVGNCNFKEVFQYIYIMMIMMSDIFVICLLIVVFVPGNCPTSNHSMCHRYYLLCRGM